MMIGRVITSALDEWGAFLESEYGVSRETSKADFVAAATAVLRERLGPDVPLQVSIIHGQLQVFLVTQAVTTPTERFQIPVLVAKRLETNIAAGESLPIALCYTHDRDRVDALKELDAIIRPHVHVDLVINDVWPALIEALSGVVESVMNEQDPPAPGSLEALLRSPSGLPITVEDGDRRLTLTGMSWRYFMSTPSGMSAEISFRLVYEGPDAPEPVSIERENSYVGRDVWGPMRVLPASTNGIGVVLKKLLVDPDFSESAAEGRLYGVAFERILKGLLIAKPPAKSLFAWARKRLVAAGKKSTVVRFEGPFVSTGGFGVVLAVPAGFGPLEGTPYEDDDELQPVELGRLSPAAYTLPRPAELVARWFEDELAALAKSGPPKDPYPLMNALERAAATGGVPGPPPVVAWEQDDLE